MPRKKQTRENKPVRPQLGDHVEIPEAGTVVQTPITETLESNYMPYAMSVIISRALPEIDGFKPAHRKLLYTMYTMGLLKGARTKSANIVGSTMHLNPHGDTAIYDTMVRLSRGNESLLLPYVDSKGNFGKAYSRDMASAAARYTEAKLEPVCAELFNDIDSDTVNFIDNYDATTTEPVLLPVTFPTILANNTLGIAVGMASNICSFNLVELCDTTIALLKNKNHDLKSTLKAPDFVGGGLILYDEEQIDSVYNTGRGSIKVRARYNYVKDGNRIEITEIPSTTTIEAIIDKMADLVKSGKLREVSDIRDEIDLNGLKLTLDLKRGQDPEKLMQKLFKLTPLEDNFACNFNILIDNFPLVMGVKEILYHWMQFRISCVERRTKHDLKGKEKRLHVLQGLEAILFDIDKAIKIIRETQEETNVISNLMFGFNIDEIQANYVAEIKLRHLNREYLLKRTQEIDDLELAIKDLNEILQKPERIKRIIIKELQEIKKKYGQERKSEILYEFSSSDAIEEELEYEDYPVTAFITKEGYFKKITPQSLRMVSTQKLKDGDTIQQSIETHNTAKMLVFTNQQRVYKASVGDFSDSKASVIGDYLPANFAMEEDEQPICVVITDDYVGHMIFTFNNGKCAKVPLKSYQTKQKRKRLLSAFSDKEPLAWAIYCKEEEPVAFISDAERMLVVDSSIIPVKTTKTSIGVTVMKMAKNKHVVAGGAVKDLNIEETHLYTAKKIPSIGALVKSTQMKLF